MTEGELQALVHACEAKGLTPAQVSQMMAAILETRWLLLPPSLRIRVDFEPPRFHDGTSSLLTEKDLEGPQNRPPSETAHLVTRDALNNRES